MGEIAALSTALLWALTSALVGTQTERVPAAVISVIQLFCASLMLWAVALPLYLTGAIEGISLPQTVALAASALIGPGLGDLLYYVAIRLLGVARAFPISMGASSLITIALAAAVAGEPVSLPVVLGAILIIGGISLITMREQPGVKLPRHASRNGILIVLAAATLWGISTVTLRVATEDVSAALAGAIRMPAAGIFALLLALGTGKTIRPGHYGVRSVATLALSGLVGTGAGALLYVLAIQHAGAARTAILSSTSPLFALPLAALLLHEAITPRVAVGTVLSIAGIWLVTL